MAKVKKKSKTGRLIGIFILELFLLVIIIGGFFVYNKMKLIQHDTTEDKNIIQNENVKNIKGYRNIVLFGVDSRQNALKKDTHSDTIIIASINNKTKDVKLASVYRDTYVNIPDRNKFDKINAAYYRGGYSLALSTINTNFDLKVKEFVTVNFDAVVKAIDLVGGIEIDVQDNEVKYVNGYTNELNRINKTNIPHIKSAGKQLLNGTQATAWSRIRYTAGGDFKRTERQRIVVEKVFEKVKGSNIATINKFINIMFPKIYTNLSSMDMLMLAKNVLSYNIVEQTGFPFEKDAHTYDRVSYVFPIDLAANVSRLHEFLYNEKDYVPSSTVQNHSSTIESIRNR
jgi:cell envelope-related function transcriptional attenuator common domain